MIEQYPHSIVVSWNEAPTQNTTTGEFTAGASHSYTFPCRAEINSSSRSLKVPGNDGDMVDYIFDVFMPLTDIVVPSGADYVLNGSVTGKVKRSQNGQLNSRLWL